MRFWQGYVIAQMAAGSVYADRYRGFTLNHFALEAASVLLAGVLWLVLKSLFPAHAGNGEKHGG
jgi:hypothetical protein